MKNYILGAMLIAAVACNNSTDSKGKGDTAFGEYNKTKPDNIVNTKCYRLVGGSSNKDTAQVQLSIQANNITGKMMTVIYEKDRRSGSLQGTLNGNAIEAVWHYMQEGVEDSMAVSFMLNNNSLTQKPIVYDAATGREKTDVNAGYSVTYTTIDCAE